jgi:hypothetical protein
MEFCPDMDFVWTDYLTCGLSAFTFARTSKQSCKMGKETKKKMEVRNPETELESIKKLVKKKELQTDILKKIIKNNKLSDNKSL